ncbi:hypothetical protein [Geopsychrobacter electrodiphilus]|uniref:hypothetical protein n=1 Tax=Geopsychrobacter electrodiphilus TaxID=225196 RepID=UPI0003789205|nr:hypothetical protein [Geopsychrobacter electrodiphilus]
MDIEMAMLDPDSAFTSPDDVFAEQSLTREQKIKILRRWEYDARELEVAEEENMGGGPPNKLDEILKFLHRLDAEIDVDHSPPTKQGGE